MRRWVFGAEMRALDSSCGRVRDKAEGERRYWSSWSWVDCAEMSLELECRADFTGVDWDVGDFLRLLAAVLEGPDCVSSASFMSRSSTSATWSDVDSVSLSLISRAAA